MQNGGPGDWLPLPEAALRLGLSIDTVRRKAKNHELSARQIKRPQGYRWEIYIGDLPEATYVPPQLDGLEPGGHIGEKLGDQIQQPVGLTDLQRADAMAIYTNKLLAPLVAELSEVRKDLVVRAEQVGRLTSELEVSHKEQEQLKAALEAAQQRIAVLESPQPPAAPEPPRIPWWIFWKRS